MLTEDQAAEIVTLRSRVQEIEIELADNTRIAQEDLMAAAEQIRRLEAPIPMLLWCPGCGARHYDEGEFATKPHHTHACQMCGMVWRPAIVPTVGVEFLPGFKNRL